MQEVVRASAPQSEEQKMEAFLHPKRDGSLQIEEERESSAVLQSDDGNKESRNIVYESHKYKKGRKFNRTAQLGEAIKDAKSNYILSQGRKQGSVGGDDSDIKNRSRAGSNEQPNEKEERLFSRTRPKS